MGARFNKRLLHDPWPYTPLSESELASEIARLSGARTIGTTDCVSFQPNGIPENWNQDRYIVNEFPLLNGSVWKLRAIFDGHLGHETVDHAAEHLPNMIRSRLQACTDIKPESVSLILSETIRIYDESLAANALSILPHEDKLSNLSDEELQNIINNTTTGGQNHSAILRCMQGTTVIIALTNPGNEDLWIASLGDSYAALGLQGEDGWEPIPLSACHSGRDIHERERIFREHPGEPEVLVRGRVLGALAVTRAIGDHIYKLPRVYTDRVFNLLWSKDEKSFIQSFIYRNHTPPYISNVPDVRHLDLKSMRFDPRARSSTDHSEKRGMCLLMCTDGLADLYDEEGVIQLLTIDSACPGIRCDNGALAILHNALGGADKEKVSAMVTVQMQDKWMDDTTILFEFL
ncbi:phosphatase 2C-like domain-containing protein [Rhodocollybia butyracea]|uniref:Phosphatase 2C-like domain-containing protein n=1 Tax=Rhodocollybia butyracea TaxID=206335 RepID=A0A9P5PQP0_9AGAR|nr:phosphatase 2C-like domain-containing protein [Rhodocollybia butyracea]